LRSAPPVQQYNINAAPLPLTVNASGRGGSSTSSNKQRTVNALTHVLLAGPHRARELADALDAIAAAEAEDGATNFLILLASPESQIYRGLYVFRPLGVPGIAGPFASRIHSHSNAAPPFMPCSLLDAMPVSSASGQQQQQEPNNTGFRLSGCFKYATSQRCFTLVSGSKSAGLTTDAVSLAAMGTAGVIAGGVVVKRGTSGMANSSSR
jgi:hypothetical protein